MSTRWCVTASMKAGPIGSRYEMDLRLQYAMMMMRRRRRQPQPAASGNSIIGLQIICNPTRKELVYPFPLTAALADIRHWIWNDGLVMCRSLSAHLATQGCHHSHRPWGLKVVWWWWWRRPAVLSSQHSPLEHLFKTEERFDWNVSEMFSSCHE